VSSKAVTQFVDGVLQHYPPFRWDESQERSWMDTLIRELSGFSDPVLTRAIGEMIRTRKDRRIPLVSECIDYCLDARRWLDAEKGKGQLSTGPAPANASFLDWTEDAFKLSRDLMSGPMGLQAAKEGWIGCLDEYCRKFKRLPPVGEIEGPEGLKRKAKEFDETYAECVRGGFQDAARWASMGEEMLAKRNNLINWRLSLR
jgi:hypothetical protein